MTKIRCAFAAALVAAFAGTPALAAQSDCLSKYDEFWQRMQRYGNAKPATEDVVATQRMALRAFDACQAGDEADFANFWENMRRYGHDRQDALRFWADLQRNGPVSR